MCRSTYWFRCTKICRTSENIIVTVGPFSLCASRPSGHCFICSTNLFLSICMPYKNMFANLRSRLNAEGLFRPIWYVDGIRWRWHRFVRLYRLFLLHVPLYLRCWPCHDGISSWPARTTQVSCSYAKQQWVVQTSLRLFLKPKCKHHKKSTYRVGKAEPQVLIFERSYSSSEAYIVTSYRSFQKLFHTTLPR